MLYVHLAQQAVEGHEPVARVEELGPQLLEEVTRLLGHARVTLKPVIDLNQGRSVNGYEHPPDVKERGFLRTTGDVFPHAQSQTRRLDSDHPKTYDADGPPGQTGDHNHAPLGRRHHRAKTHLDYQVHQISPGSTSGAPRTGSGDSSTVQAPTGSRPTSRLAASAFARSSATIRSGSSAE